MTDYYIQSMLQLNIPFSRAQRFPFNPPVKLFTKIQPAEYHYHKTVGKAASYERSKSKVRYLSSVRLDDVSPTERKRDLRV